MSLINKIHKKSDWFDGSIVNVVRQPILHSFVLDKTPGGNFLEAETMCFKKINKSVLNTIKRDIETVDHKEVKFKGETLTFTFQLVKIKVKMFQNF